MVIYESGRLEPAGILQRIFYPHTLGRPLGRLGEQSYEKVLPTLCLHAISHKNKPTGSTYDF